MSAWGMRRSHSVRRQELGVAGGEIGAEVILPSLEGSFGCVASVAMWWYSLEGDMIFLICFFEFIGAFIVEDVEFGCICIRLQLGVQETCPGIVLMMS